VGDLAGAGRAVVSPHVADDHRTIAEAELRAVVLPVRTRSANANASVSQASASRTSGEISTGITVASGTERFLFI